MEYSRKEIELILNNRVDLFRHLLFRSRSNNPTTKQIHHVFIPRSNLKGCQKRFTNPRLSESLLEDQRNLIKEFLRINKIQLKTFLQFYSGQINESKCNEKGKRKLIDTIPSTVNNLDDIITSPSHASKFGFSSSNNPKNQTYDQSFYSRPDNKSNPNTKRLLNEDIPENIKDPPISNKVMKHKAFDFSENRLSTERIPKLHSPVDSLDNNKDQNLTYSPASQSKEVNRDNNYTELTQKHTTYIKEIIKNAGIEISNDEVTENPLSNAFIPPPEANEHPTFFETCVDIPPYLKSKEKGKVNEIPLINTQFGIERNLNPGFDLGFTTNGEKEEKAKSPEKPPVFDKNIAAMLNINKRMYSKASAPKIIGRRNYNNCRDFMEEHFNHRELIAMKDLNRVDRIKYSRKYYRGSASRA